MTKGAMPAGAPSPPFRIALVGAGRVGTAVAELLRRKGHTIVGVASRTRASAERAAGLLRTHALDLPRDPLPDANIVLIGATDDAIPSVVRQLVEVARPGSVAWHVSGSSGIAPLDPLADRGVLGCAVHPMQACPNVDAALANLPGSSWGVTTTPGMRPWAHRLVEEDLTGFPVDLTEGQRPLWHAASITTSTGVAAVAASGEALLREIGVAAPHEALRPLIDGTIEHLRRQERASHAVTGPIVRGEKEIVARHLRALGQTSDQSLLESYLLVARLVLERAKAAGLMDQAAERMVPLLTTLERSGDQDPDAP